MDPLYLLILSSLTASVGIGVLREASLPQNHPFVSRSSRVFRSIKGISQLILLSVGLELTFGSSVYSIDKSMFYCLDSFPKKYTP
jgi:hypothetical protein